MLSGGARCRQTARHLATSRVTFWSCGRQPRRAPPASSRSRREDRRRSRSGLPRPQPAEVRTAPDPLTRPSAPGLRAPLPSRPQAAARTDGLARSLDPAAAAWVPGLRRGPQRAGSQIARVWCWGQGGGIAIWEVDPNRWAVPRGPGLRRRCPVASSPHSGFKALGGGWLPGGGRPVLTRASLGRGQRET